MKKEQAEREGATYYMIITEDGTAYSRTQKAAEKAGQLFADAGCELVGILRRESVNGHYKTKLIKYI